MRPGRVCAGWTVTGGGGSGGLRHWSRVTCFPQKHPNNSGDTYRVRGSLRHLPGSGNTKPSRNNVSQVRPASYLYFPLWFLYHPWFWKGDGIKKKKRLLVRWREGGGGSPDSVPSIPCCPLCGCSQLREARKFTFKLILEFCILGASGHSNFRIKILFGELRVHRTY